MANNTRKRARTTKREDENLSWVEIRSGFDEDRMDTPLSWCLPAERPTTGDDEMDAALDSSISVRLPASGTAEEILVLLDEVKEIVEKHWDPMRKCPEAVAVMMFDIRTKGFDKWRRKNPKATRSPSELWRVARSVLDQAAKLAFLKRLSSKERTDFIHLYSPDVEIAQFLLSSCDAIVDAARKGTLSAGGEPVEKQRPRRRLSRTR